MTKTLSLIVICLSIAAAVNAQDVDKIAQLSCDCLAGKDFTNIPRSQVEMALGLCILEASNGAGFEFDPTDADASRKLGEKVGISMVTKCPEVFSKLTDMMADNLEEEVAVEELWEATGKVKSVDVGDVVTVTVKESSGKEVKYLWLRYFSGSDDFVKEPKKLVGKEISIVYREIECYMAKAGGYFKQKELASIVIK